MLLEIKVLTVSVALSALGGLRWINKVHHNGWCYPDLIVVSLLVTGLVFADIWRLRPGTSHSFSSVFFQYLAQKVVLLFGTLLHKKLDKLSHDVEKHQRELLQKILRQNKMTKLFKYLNLTDISDVRDYVARVPLTRYETYRVFVDDIETNGTEDVFFPGKTDYIAVTSGTSTGMNKRFPKCRKMLKNMGKAIITAQKCFLRVPRNNYLRKLLAIRLCPRFWFSKSGIKCGPISGLSSSMSLSCYVAPIELLQLTNETTALYLNVLFGLKEEYICNLFFPTSSLAMLYFQTMELSWEQACSDIEIGEISEDLEISCELRKTLTKHLGPGDPERARFLRNIFRQGFKDLVPRIWPSCPVLFCLATGSFAAQAKIVKEQYLGDIDIISPFHASTETLYGINIHVEDPDTTYVATTTLNFFEFIPVEEVHLENPRTYFAHEVEIGQEYELVVTTFDGLYRYRTEDVVRITGFLGTIPRYSFSRRSGDLLVCGTVRIPETIVSRAVSSASQHWGGTVVGSTCTESVHLENALGQVSYHQSYVVFVELEPGSTPLTEKQKALVDEELVARHDIYGRFRKHGNMAPVKVIDLVSGSLTSVHFRSIENPNSTCMQYKLPRIIRRESVLRYLIDNGVKSESNLIQLPSPS